MYQSLVSKTEKRLKNNKKHNPYRKIPCTGYVQHLNLNRMFVVLFRLGSGLLSPASIIMLFLLLDILLLIIEDYRGFVKYAGRKSMPALRVQGEPAVRMINGSGEQDAEQSTGQNIRWIMHEEEHAGEGDRGGQ